MIRLTEGRQTGHVTRQSHMYHQSFNFSLFISVTDKCCSQFKEQQTRIMHRGTFSSLCTGWRGTSGRSLHPGSK